MKKILKIGVIVMLVFLLIGFIYMHVSLPNLQEGATEIIEQVINEELPALKGTEGYAYNGDVKIWYESRMPVDSLKGSILLIMGMSNDAFSWPEFFIDPLVESGYQVIRMDNRGTGMSDWMDNWNLLETYTLEEMALDCIAVLDTLKIKKVHLVGISLGGMIAQTLAIHHPERSASLTSMMSTGYYMDSELPATNPILVTDLFMANVRYGIFKTESNIIKLHLIGRELLKGDNQYEIDVDDVARSVLYNYRYRRGDNPLSFRQQSQAILKSGSRYEELNKLKIPSLIIHGIRDPMVPFEHGVKCYELIPNARKLWIDGMGHDIPEVFVDKVISSILQLINEN